MEAKDVETGGCGLSTRTLGGAVCRTVVIGMEGAGIATPAGRVVIVLLALRLPLDDFPDPTGRVGVGRFKAMDVVVASKGATMEVLDFSAGGIVLLSSARPSRLLVIEGTSDPMKRTTIQIAAKKRIANRAAAKAIHRVGNPSTRAKLRDQKVSG